VNKEGKNPLGSRKEAKIEGPERRKHAGKMQRRCYGRGLALQSDTVEDVVAGTNTTAPTSTGAKRSTYEMQMWNDGSSMNQL